MLRANCFLTISSVVDECGGAPSVLAFARSTRGVSLFSQSTRPGFVCVYSLTGRVTVSNVHLFRSDANVCRRPLLFKCLYLLPYCDGCLLSVNLVLLLGLLTFLCAYGSNVG